MERNYSSDPKFCIFHCSDYLNQLVASSIKLQDCRIRKQIYTLYWFSICNLEKWFKYIVHENSCTLWINQNLGLDMKRNGLSLIFCKHFLLDRLNHWTCGFWSTLNTSTANGTKYCNFISMAETSNFCKQRTTVSFQRESFISVK